MYLRINLRVAGIRVAIPSTLIDISAGGCQLHARTMLKPRVGIEYDLPRQGRPSLRIAGTIKKVTYTPDDRTFRYAVEFDALDYGVRDELLRFITEEQRRVISGTRGTAPEPTEVADASKTLTRLQELRGAHRVEVNVPVRYTVGDSPSPFSGTAVDISTGGIRVIVDQVLRQEWNVTVRFTLPNEMLKTLAQLRGNAASMRPFSELKFLARPLGGVKQSRGRFVQSLVFVNPDPQQTDEISRFVQVAKLTTLRRS
jgi:c-di-GMP-binding flagellar brake protein YcgR